MVELNREQLLDELSNFEKKKSASDIPDILNKYLESVAENGDTIFPWNKLQPLLRRKLEIVMNEFNEKCPTDHLIQLPNVKQFDFDELKAEILEAIDAFTSAPFTVQRLCELITNPSKHYKRTDKFMRGIEKNILVVSTIEPKSAIGDDSHYVSTSSFKNLFSALHSSMNSLQSSSSTSGSSSLLVNGIAGAVPCDNNQISIHSTNEDMSDSKQNVNKCPVSPTSLPLSPTTNSPPSQQLPPLQQLDSFTTVFASSPSTPLSVVSDLHSYEQSSSLSLISSTPCPKSPKDNPSYTVTTTDPKDTENSATFESTSPHSGLDSSVTSNTPQDNTSTTNDDNQIKEEQDFTNKSLHDFNDSEASDKTETETETETDSKISQDFSHSANTDMNDSNNNNDNNDTINSSFEPNDNKIINECEGVSPKTKSISDDITSSDVESNQENKPLIEDFPNSPKNQSEIVESSNNQMRGRGDDEDMSSPMDYCGSNNSTNSSDFIDKTSDLTPDCNIMDETLSQSDQSDQSEPMDED